MNDLKYYLGLNKIYSLRGRLKLLLDNFQSAKEAYFASKNELKKMNLSDEVISRIIEEREQLNLDEELRLIEKNNVKVVTINDEEYPAGLTNIFDPPIVLYIKGELRVEDDNTIAVVGSRRATSYGLAITKQLVKELTNYKFTIISGFARGIDTQAHKTAIENKASTIAVLGCGINVCYPPENKYLLPEIEKYGAIVTEFPFDTPPHSFNFPIRNRIISGLAKAVVVIQAAEKSGALITAYFALDQGKEVFAVPGNINIPQSKGVNKLIKEGAKLVDSVEDILEELGYKMNKIKKKKEIVPELKGIEKLLFDNIPYEPKHIDEIIKELNLLPHIALSTLLELEMKGLITQLPGKMFMRLK